MDKSVTCHACGDTWPRDPALEVPCPNCHATVGAWCVRPSGHKAELHHERDLAAMTAGKLVPCRAVAPEADLFAPPVEADAVRHELQPSLF